MMVLFFDDKDVGGAGGEDSRGYVALEDASQPGLEPTSDWITVLQDSKEETFSLRIET